MTLYEKLMAIEAVFETKLQVDIVCTDSLLCRQLLWSLFGSGDCYDKTISFAPHNGISSSGWDNDSDTVVTSSVPIEAFARFKVTQDDCRLSQFVFGCLPEATDALRLRAYAAAGHNQVLLQVSVIDDAMEQPIGICGTARRAPVLCVPSSAADDMFQGRGTHLTIEPSLCFNTLTAAFGMLTGGDKRRRSAVPLQLKMCNGKLYIHFDRLSAIHVGEVKVHRHDVPVLDLGTEHVHHLVDLMLLSQATLSLCWSPTLQSLRTESSTGWQYERLTVLR